MEPMDPGEADAEPGGSGEGGAKQPSEKDGASEQDAAWVSAGSAPKTSQSEASKASRPRRSSVLLLTRWGVARAGWTLEGSGRGVEVLPPAGRDAGPVSRMIQGRRGRRVGADALALVIGDVRGSRPRGERWSSEAGQRWRGRRRAPVWADRRKRDVRGRGDAGWVGGRRPERAEIRNRSPSGEGRGPRVASFPGSRGGGQAPPLAVAVQGGWLAIVAIPRPARKVARGRARGGPAVWWKAVGAVRQVGRLGSVEGRRRAAGRRGYPKEGVVVR
jgi:hypothetical protein